MLNNLLPLCSLLLIATALVVFLQRRHRPVANAVFGVEFGASCLLLAVYLIADRLSGNGFDEAVLYHLRASVSGAAFGDFPLETAAALIAGLGIPVLSLLVPRLTRKRRMADSLIWEVPLLILPLAIIANPLLHDIARLTVATPPPQGDFGTYYRRPVAKPLGRPRNLVIIYAEGLERSYFDQNRFPGLAPELRGLAPAAVSFTGINSAVGSTWTIAGMVASQCGIPLFAPGQGNSMGGMDMFLPGVVGLGGLLKTQGYRLVYMGGADLRFAGKGNFYRTQGFDEVLGGAELLPRLLNPKYRTPWGLYDDALFELAAEKYDALLRTGDPFALFLLTLDTHPPHGHRSLSVADVAYADGKNPMLNAVAAADVLVARFIRRLRADPRSANTVIVLVSDHLAMTNDASALLESGRRDNLFMILDPSIDRGRTVDVFGSTMDVGPTLLPFLGFSGEIGLGRNLLDPRNEPAERAFLQRPETLLGWRRELMKYWGFPDAPDRLLVNADAQSVSFGERSFPLPCLIEIAPTRQTVIRFEPEVREGPLLTEYLTQIARR